MTNRQENSIIDKLNTARPVGQAVKTLASHAENMGSIPVRVTNDRKQDISPAFSFSVVGDPYAHQTQHLAQSATVHGFETLLRRFRVGSLAGRSKFPYKIPSGSMPSGFFSYSDADLYQVKHTPRCRIDQKNGARHNTKLICNYFFVILPLGKLTIAAINDVIIKAVILIGSCGNRIPLAY